MHKKINYLFIPLAAILLCLPFPASGQTPSGPSTSESIQKEKEMLARRAQLAQMESEIIAYQRRQLDIEMRDISRLTKEVAGKERQLQIQQAQNKGSSAAQGSVRDRLRQKLEEQSSLLAQARRQVEEERRNLDLRIENLKAERVRQELERQNFLSNAAQQDARRKEQQYMEKTAALHKDLRSCQQALSQKEQEQKERERARDARSRQMRAEAAERKRLLLRQQQQTIKVIEEENKSAGQRSLQDRIDNLLEKQQKLLNASRQVEQDLGRQKEDMQWLLDHSRAEAIKGEAQ